MFTSSFVLLIRLFTRKSTVICIKTILCSCW